MIFHDYKHGLSRANAIGFDTAEDYHAPWGEIVRTRWCMMRYCVIARPLHIVRTILVEVERIVQSKIDSADLRE